MILSVDIGGTKIRLASLQKVASLWSLDNPSTIDSSRVESFSDVIRNSIKPEHEAIAIGVAGPVHGNAADLSNLEMSVDGSALTSEFKVPVYLINDLAAHANGIQVLDSQKITCLNEAKKQDGTQVLIAAGTGLGESVLGWDGRQNYPVPSEGGHSDFAPLCPADIKLWEFLNRKYGHVSWERVVSGADGFNNLVAFHIDQKFTGYEPWVDRLNAHKTVAFLVSEFADSGEDFAVNIMKEFVRFYGAEAGNLALKAVATGGVYVGGGIAPKIKKWMTSGGFIESYVDKGRFSDLLRSFPVWLIEDGDLALKGAAQFAENMLSASRSELDVGIT